MNRKSEPLTILVPKDVTPEERDRLIRTALLGQAAMIAFEQEQKIPALKAEMERLEQRVTEIKRELADDPA